MTYVEYAGVINKKLPEQMISDRTTTHAQDFPVPARDPLQPLRHIFITLWLGVLLFGDHLP
jgi:hypothetical protein